MSRLRVEVHEGEGAFDALREPWEALHRRSGATPFLSWQWQEAWWRHLAPERVPLLLAARRGEEVVGLMALARERQRGIRRLSFLGERVGGADYLDLLAAREDQGRVAAAFVDHLASEIPFDLLDLDDMPAESQLLPALMRRFLDQAGSTRRLLLRHVCPQIELAESWEAQLRRSSRSANFKRRLRQLAALEGFSFRIAREGKEAAAAFERFVDLHGKRWSQRGGSDALDRPAALRFHREVARRFADAGWLCFEELWVEGACRATIYGMDVGESHIFFQSGFDPAWGGRSVGLVLLGLSIEHAISRGKRIYDFLHGTEAYKFDWATGSRQTVGLRIAAAGLWPAVWRAGEEAEAIARAAAHSLLPERAVGALRRMRKAWG